MKLISIVTVTAISLEAFLPQIVDFFGEEAIITGYALENNPQVIKGDIILYRTHSSYDEIKVLCLNQKADMIYMASTFDKKQIDKITAIPPNENVLVVNSQKYLIYDCIQQFKQIVPYNLNYVPYSENDKFIDTSKFDYAITFIEDNDLNVANIINVGIRKIHAKTYEQILNKHFMHNEYLNKKLLYYKKSFFELSFTDSISLSIKNSYQNSVSFLIELLDNAVLILDKNNIIHGYNEKFCNIFRCHLELYKNYSIFDVPDFVEIFNQIERAGEHIKIQISHRGIKQSLTIWKQMVPLYNQGDIMKFIFIEPAIMKKNVTNKVYNSGKFSFEDIIYRCEAMSHCIEIAKKISNSNNTVLINGETGTGKELLASAIHKYSPRKNMPFVAINCAAFHETLLESELFGYEAGTFTGGLKQGKKGIFELADGGTVFLDEIGDASHATQSALLRVLQEKEVRRVGGLENIPVDIRIISATNRDLKEDISLGSFRKDLYYRLSTFGVHIPPLRERRGDIKWLIQRFMDQTGYSYKRISSEVLTVLENCDWSGNIRELRNCVEYFSFMSSEEVTLKDLPDEYQPKKRNKVMPSADYKEPILSEDEYKRQNSQYLTSEKRKLYSFILQQLSHGSCGRPALLSKCLENGIAATEYDIKQAFHYLHEKQLIVKSRGRGGSSITNLGVEFMNKLDLIG